MTHKLIYFCHSGASVSPPKSKGLDLEKESQAGSPKAHHLHLGYSPVFPFRERHERRGAGRTAVTPALVIAATVIRDKNSLHISPPIPCPSPGSHNSPVAPESVLEEPLCEQIFVSLCHFGVTPV